MRYIVCYPDGSVLDTGTGAITSGISLEQLLLEKPGGVIVGNNLYPVISRFIPDQRGDTGWTSSLSLQRKRQLKDRVGGVIYYRYLTYRFAKEIDSTKMGARRKCRRPAAIKWLVFNLELWAEVSSSELLIAAETLVNICERRGITPRSSPGAFGSALLRSSSEWTKGRECAPRFISELGRERQPGNHYELKQGYTRAPRAYYLDQSSAHHRIAAEIKMPHPQFLRARGMSRAAKDDVKGNKRPKWIGNMSNLEGHTGLLCAVIETGTIPRQMAHLYPDWCKGKGKQVQEWGKRRKVVWIWTPELRLLDSRVKLRWVTAAFTSFIGDPAIKEYANWAMDYLATKPHPIAKPTLHAPYGMLGVKTQDSMERYFVHGREKPLRAEVVKFPLIGDVFHSIIERRVTPSLQNVVARGVLEAETLTRSLEFARKLEAEGHGVIQIYADGVITTATQLPFMPNGWRVAAELTGVTSPHPNSIQSNELIRLPGIPHGRRSSVNREHLSESDLAEIQKAQEIVATLDAGT